MHGCEAGLFCLAQVLVSFNRCQYAQLLQQQFEAPKMFPMVAHTHPDRRCAVHRLRLVDLLPIAVQHN